MTMTLGLTSGGPHLAIDSADVRKTLDRNPKWAHPPTGDDFWVNAWGADTTLEVWKPVWRKILGGEVSIRVDALGDLNLRLSAEVAWRFANEGTDDDRKAVAAKFPDHSLTREWKEGVEKAETERKAAVDGYPGEVTAAVDAKSAVELGRLIAQAPAPELRTLALDGLKKVFTALKAKPVTPPHWVSVTEPTELLDAPSTPPEHEDEEEVDGVNPGTEVAHVATVGKYALILFPKPRGQTEGDLKELLECLGTLRWVPTSSIVDLAKWKIDKEHMDEVHAAVDDTEFGQLVRAMVQLQMSLTVPAHAYQQNEWRMQLKQSKFFFCQTRAKLLKKVSAADLIKVAREVCDEVHEQSTDGGYAVEIPATKCMANVQKPACP